MNYSDIKEINTVNDLKQKGELQELLKEINKMIAPLKAEANSFEELFTIVLYLKTKCVDFIDDYFVNEKARYEFILTHVDGKRRNELLGITDEMYRDSQLAKKWFRNIAKFVHPDSDTTDNKAFLVLKELYDILVEEEDE